MEERELNLELEKMRGEIVEVIKEKGIDEFLKNIMGCYSCSFCGKKAEALNWVVLEEEKTIWFFCDEHYRNLVNNEHLDELVKELDPIVNIDLEKDTIHIVEIEKIEYLGDKKISVTGKNTYFPFIKQGEKYLRKIKKEVEE